jgi:hypothetical protein
MSRKLQGAMVAAGLVGAVAMAAIGSREAIVSKAGGKGGVASQERLVVPPLPASIQLQGLTDRMGAATAGYVTVRVGALGGTPQPTPLPQYNATVSGARAQDMVSVVVEGQGVKFTAILGTYARLAALAGPDRQLTLEESDALRVSPLTTAMEFATRRNLGGMPQTDAQHEAEWRTIVDAGPYYGADLGTIAAILDATASGELSLPQGFETGYALVEDRTAATAFVRENPDVAYGRAALARLASTPVLDSDVAAPVALLGARVDRSAPIIAATAEVLARQPAGWLVHSATAQDPRHSGAIGVDGRVALLPVDAPYTERFEFCSGGQQGVRRDTLISREYRLQRRGVQTGVWVGVEEYEAVYPECLGFPPQRYQSVFLAAGVALRGDDSPRVAFAKTNAIDGLRGLPYFCPVTFTESGGPRTTIQQCEYTPHRFDAGGVGAVLELGRDITDSGEPLEPVESKALTWSKGADAEFSVDYDGFHTRFWRIDRDQAAATGVVYVSEATVDGRQLTLAGYAPMLNGNPPTGDLLSSPVGTWAFATFEQDRDPYFYADETSVTRSVFKADGKLDEHFWYVADGPGSFLPGLRTWRYVGPRLYMTTARLVSGNGRYYDCAEAAAAGRTDCFPSRVRVFRPMRKEGNRVYGIEDLYFNTTPRASPPYVFSRSSRATYHEQRSVSTDPPVTTSTGTRHY